MNNFAMFWSESDVWYECNFIESELINMNLCSIFFYSFFFMNHEIHLLAWEWIEVEPQPLKKLNWTFNHWHVIYKNVKKIKWLSSWRLRKIFPNKVRKGNTMKYVFEPQVQTFDFNKCHFCLIINCDNGK